MTNNITYEISSPSSFNHWMKQHGKNYGSNLEAISRRQSIFKQNEQYIATHNLKNAPYNLALGKFADLSTNEFQDKYLGLTKKVVDASRVQQVEFSLDNDNPPLAVDWRKHGVVTKVKNQGGCGSCWAFAIVGTIEVAHAIKSGRLVSFSEQELIDCVVPEFYNRGCNGGGLDTTLNWVLHNGITMESLYPYKAKRGESCNLEKLNNTYTITIDDYVIVPQYNETALLQAVANVPVVVGIDASSSDFQLYSSGILTQDFIGLSCGDTLDHAMLVVGYGSKGGVDYWILKNSWGSDWGEEGYMRLQRNVDKEGRGVCGINYDAMYAVVNHTDVNVLPIDEIPSSGLSKVMLDRQTLVAIPFSLLILFLTWLF